MRLGRFLLTQDPTRSLLLLLPTFFFRVPSSTPGHYPGKAYLVHTSVWQRKLSIACLPSGGHSLPIGEKVGAVRCGAVRCALTRRAHSLTLIQFANLKPKLQRTAISRQWKCGGAPGISAIPTRTAMASRVTGGAAGEWERGKS